MNKAYTQPKKDNILEVIKLESDSEDAQTIEKNKCSEIQNQKPEIINLDENVENPKSNSQSSISTSASRGNLPLNKPNIQVKNDNNNSSLLTISQRTKKILDRINEKNKKAKLLNQFNQLNPNKENENNEDKNVFIGKKTRSKEPNSADKKIKEKKIKLSTKTKEAFSLSFFNTSFNFFILIPFPFLESQSLKIKSAKYPPKSSLTASTTNLFFILINLFILNLLISKISL